MNKIDINGNDKAQNDHTDYSANYGQRKQFFSLLFSYLEL